MSKPKEKKPVPPTDEQFGHGQYTEELIGPSLGAPKRYRRRDGSEIDRLLFAGLIGPDEHTTLSRFAKDLYDAGMVWSPKSGINSASTTGHSQFIADNAFRRVLGMKGKMELLADELPSMDRLFLLSVLTDDKRVDNPAQLRTLKAGASILQPLYSR